MEEIIYLGDTVPKEYEQMGLPFIVSMGRSWRIEPPEKIEDDESRRIAFDWAVNEDEAKGADALMVGYGKARVTDHPIGYTMGRASFTFPVVAYRLKK
jgi:hypothetical protein